MLKFIDPTERWNVFTHALGVILGIEVSIYFFAQHSSEQPRVLIALGIYCFSLVFLFSASTMYHAVSYHKHRQTCAISQLLQTRHAQLHKLKLVHMSVQHQNFIL